MNAEHRELCAQVTAGLSVLHVVGKSVYAVCQRRQSFVNVKIRVSQISANQGPATPAALDQFAGKCAGVLNLPFVQLGCSHRQQSSHTCTIVASVGMMSGGCSTTLKYVNSRL